MRIRYLQEFEVLAKIGNFTMAAKQLGITQTALSRHLQHLEQELDTELMTRSTRQMKLTKEGKRFLRFAQDTLAVHGDMTDALAELGEVEGRSVSLRIAAPQNVGAYGLDEFYLNFAKNNPDIICTMMQAEGDTMFEMLRNEICDAGLMMGVPEFMDEKEGIDYHHFIVHDEMVVAMNRMHPLATEPSIDLKKLSREAFVKLPTGTATAYLTKAICERAGFHPRTALRALREPDAISYLRDQNHIALLFRKPSEYAIERKNIQDVELHAINPPIVADLYLLCRKGDSTYALQTLIHAIDDLVKKAREGRDVGPC